MKSKVKMMIASVAIGAFVSTAGAYLASAGNDCKNECAIAAKACHKDCGDDEDCQLECIGANFDCIEDCDN